MLASAENWDSRVRVRIAASLFQRHSKNQELANFHSSMNLPIRLQLYGHLLVDTRVYTSAHIVCPLQLLTALGGVRIDKHLCRGMIPHKEYCWWGEVTLNFPARS